MVVELFEVILRWPPCWENKQLQAAFVLSSCCMFSDVLKGRQILLLQAAAASARDGPSGAAEEGPEGAGSPDGRSTPQEGVLSRDCQALAQPVAAAQVASALEELQGHQRSPWVSPCSCSPRSQVSEVAEDPGSRCLMRPSWCHVE